MTHPVQTSRDFLDNAQYSLTASAAFGGAAILTRFLGYDRTSVGFALTSAACLSGSMVSLYQAFQTQAEEVQNARAANQGLNTQNQQLRAQNQQLRAQNQQLRAQNQQLHAENLQQRNTYPEARFTRVETVIFRGVFPNAQ